jgi:hypothetical protein
VDYICSLDSWKDWCTDEYPMEMINEVLMKLTSSHEGDISIEMPVLKEYQASNADQRVNDQDGGG